MISALPRIMGGAENFVPNYLVGGILFSLTLSGLSKLGGKEC